MENTINKIIALLATLMVLTIIASAVIVAAFALETAMPAQEFVDYLANTIGCQNTLETMEEEDLLTESETAFIQQYGYVTTAIGLRAAMLANGFYPVPNEILNVEVPERVTNTYKDVYATAITMNLISTSENVLYPMTATVFNTITEKLSAAQPLNISYDFHGLMDETTINRHNYTALNALLVDQYDLPEEYVEQFLADGWKYEFAESAICNGAVYQIGAGLCSYDNKRIYINDCSERTITHEFGHYISIGVRNTTEYKASFSEAGNVAAMLRTYSLSNVHEYFADCVSLWLREPEKWDEFSLLAPKSAALVESVLA